VEKHVRERSNVPPGAAQPALPASIDARADGRYEVALDGLRLPVVAEVQRRTSSGSVVMADTLRYARTR
jgi:hypothetical protein